MSTARCKRHFAVLHVALPRARARSSARSRAPARRWRARARAAAAGRRARNARPRPRRPASRSRPCAARTAAATHRSVRRCRRTRTSKDVGSGTRVFSHSGLGPGAEALACDNRSQATSQPRSLESTPRVECEAVAGRMVRWRRVSSMAIAVAAGRCRSSAAPTMPPRPAGAEPRARHRHRHRPPADVAADADSDDDRGYQRRRHPRPHQRDRRRGRAEVLPELGRSQALHRRLRPRRARHPRFGHQQQRPLARLRRRHLDLEPARQRRVRSRRAGAS